MEKTKSVNIRITEKEKEFIKNHNINVTDLFTNALKNKMVYTNEYVEQNMADKIGKALGVKITFFYLLGQTNDSQMVQFGFRLKGEN